MAPFLALAAAALAVAAVALVAPCGISALVSDDVFVTEALVSKHLGLSSSSRVGSWPERRARVVEATRQWGQHFAHASHQQHQQHQQHQHQHQQHAQGSTPTTAPDSKYGFFRWLPQFLAAVNISTTAGADATWPNRCFKHNAASATLAPDGSAALTFSFGGKAPLAACSDTYFVATIDALAVVTLKTDLVGTKGTYTVHWNATTATGDEREAIQWDLGTKGIRIFRLITDKAQAVEDLVQTLGLFVSEAVNPVPAATATANMDFLSTYTPFPMQQRAGGPVPFDPSEIRSGDFFGIVRLDGLDPLLAWAMGSSTGHTTVALWNRQGSADELMVCESTAKDVYWPTNGVQCTRYAQWIAQATEAGFNVVLLPLNDTAANLFNETKAWAWMESVIGLDYGYSVMFWSWVDTLRDNYPCTAPDFKDTDNSTCFSWELLEVLAPLLDKLVPALKFGDTFIKEAWCHRLGIPEHWNSSMAVIYREAGKQGIDMRSVPAMVEQDSWRYHSTRNGAPIDDAHAMVCCVFVCNMWKNAGVFQGIGSDFQCGELTNLDVYSMQTFTPQSATNRPSKCMQADPSNPSCQVWPMRLQQSGP